MKKFDQCNLFNLPLAPTVAHGGTGTILFKRIATSNELDGHIHFMDFTVMPPGTTVGEHRHSNNEEEYYLILEGNGLMTRGHDRFEVGPGDLVRNPPGRSHGLQNIGKDNLTMFVFEVETS